jgi:hypothetical protein
MNRRIHQLLHRHLQDVFGEGDAARRRAAIDELYIEDCVLGSGGSLPWTQWCRRGDRRSARPG